MKYWLDTEFLDTGRTIDLVSIGLVSEDGREYYAQSVDFDEDIANDWVRKNVFPSLYSDCPMFTVDSQRTLAEMKYLHASRRLYDDHAKLYNCSWRHNYQIRDEIKAFCDPEQYGKPELVGWCCSYDHVALCQLFGTMMDLPESFPHYMIDIQYLLDKNRITDDMLPKQESGLHNALSDAKQIKAICEWLVMSGVIEE